MEISRGFSFMENMIAFCLLSSIGVLLLQQGQLVHKMHRLHIRYEAVSWLNYVAESVTAGSAVPEIPKHLKLSTSSNNNITTFIMRYGPKLHSYIQREQVI